MIKLEPISIYDKAIIGILDNNILYDYNLIIDSLAEEYMNNDSISEPNFEDALNDAIEWYDTNIARSLCYLNSKEKPIIVKKPTEFELSNEIFDDLCEYIKFNEEFWMIVG